ncbi:hypothetical protein H2200_009008 [Cladophialophora chaetospira]|uniref:Uncharacterized protein n=1 Tax=Cladophialophora chaetospira TaxID=386627 RepID=A0AA39CG94_9EURO|nr:hypothetical protein H2200_009008 [Cladophialophora chaetospira]
MQTKTLFISAVFAFASASTASEHEHELRSPQNDNFGHVPSNARNTVAKVHGPISAQELLKVPQLAAQLAKRASSFCITTSSPDCENFLTDFYACQSQQCVESLYAKCPITISEECPGEDASQISTVAQPDQSSLGVAAEPAGQLEVKDDNEHHVVARAGSKISEAIESAMPANVKNALINDPKAAASLDKEFSGTKVPQWYAKLPASVTNYYATITSPPAMTSSVAKGPEQEKVDDWVAKVQSYKSKLAPELSAMSKAAVSESREAKRLSEAASKNSKAASKNHNDRLQTTAWSEAKKAATMSHDASTKSAYAAAASRAVFPSGKKHNGASNTDKSLALGLSIAGAVVCLGFAVAL